MSDIVQPKNHIDDDFIHPHTYETICFDGQLEVDTVRGVIYFHSSHTGTTLLRICGLNLSPFPPVLGMIDVTHMKGCSITGMNH